MSNKKQAAKAAKVVVEANREAMTGFNSANVIEIFRGLDGLDITAAITADDRAVLAVKLCGEAKAMADASRETGATEIDKGWSKEIRALLPQMASEGSRFVTVKIDPVKGTTHTLTGHGRNVNSIARGYCQYEELSPEDTFDACKKAVIARRAEDRSDEEKALAEAKAALAEAMTAVRKVATSGDSPIVILRFAAMLDDIADGCGRFTPSAQADAIDVTSGKEMLVREIDADHAEAITASAH